MHDDDDCLYHYCSTATFHAIVHSQTIRLSSLALSNDSLEGKVVSETIRKLVEQQGKGHADLLAEIKTTDDRRANALGFCLSQDGDLLSQWRGYAMDGAGLSIGFSKNYLDQFTRPVINQIQLERVQYRKVAEVMAEFEKIFRELDADEAAYYGNVHAHARQRQGYMLGLYWEKFKVKSDAFKEELEWRLLTYQKGEFFRPASNCLIPYMELALKDPEQAITKVILGPKHVTPRDVVEEFLKKSGFVNVQVFTSQASYR